MAQGSWSKCPARGCGWWQWANLHLENVTIVGFAMNVATRCKWCGREYDMTSGQDGTYSTVGGRLKLVQTIRAGARSALADAPTKSDLARLADALAAAPAEPAAIADAVASLQTFPRLEAWVRNNPAGAKLAAGFLGILFTALAGRFIVEGGKEPTPTAPPPAIDVTVDQPSEDELDRLIREAIDRREREAPAADNPIGAEHP